MKTMVALLVVSCVLSLGIAQPAWQEPQGSHEHEYLLEGLGGVAGFAVGTGCAVGLGVGVASALYDPRETGLLANFDAAVGGVIAGCALGLTVPAWTGYGVSKVGDAMDACGSAGGAVAGAYIAGPVAIGIGLLGYWVSHRNYEYRPDVFIPALVLGALTIPTGAVIGYNWHSGREPGLYGARLKGRLGMPLVMLDRVERTDRSTGYGVRVQLASVNF